MSGYISGGCNEHIVLREEVPDVAELGEEEENPGVVVRLDRR